MVKIKIYSIAIFTLLTSLFACERSDEYVEKETVTGNQITARYKGEIAESAYNDSLDYVAVVFYIVQREIPDYCDPGFFGDCYNPGPYHENIKVCAIDTMNIASGSRNFNFYFNVNHPCIEPLTDESHYEGFELVVFNKAAPDYEVESFGVGDGAEPAPSQINLAQAFSDNVVIESLLYPYD